MANVGLKPRNKTEERIISICTRAHDALADYIGVASTQEFGRTAYWGEQANHVGLWYQHSKQSVVNFRLLYGENVKTMLEIIGHELRHAEQYKKGYMDAPWGGFGRNRQSIHGGKWEEGYWKGERYSGPYNEAPWEIDARKAEKEYASMMIDMASISPEELDLTLPGQRTTYYNEEQKKAEFEKNCKEAVQWYYADTCTKEQDEENKRLMKEEWIAAGMIPPTGTRGKAKYWTYPKNKSKAATMRKSKVFDHIKRKYKSASRKDAVAYLTASQLRACKEASLSPYWEAQKNILELDLVEMSMADVTY